MTTLEPMPPRLRWEPYLEQCARWPASGRVVLAQYDDETIVVYQAYRASIAAHAVKHQRLGGDGFSRSRMSWVKPNFLWMMYRSGWGTKENQESTLAIRLKRAGFVQLLEAAVPSSYWRHAYPTRADWETAVATSDVRLQWDPDHDPMGNACERRAIQLGLRGEMLRSFIDEWTVEIEDVSALVAEQREHRHQADLGQLMTPHEEVFDHPVGPTEPPSTRPSTRSLR
jgi:hypothetical protein